MSSSCSEDASSGGSSLPSQTVGVQAAVVHDSGGGVAGGEASGEGGSRKRPPRLIRLSTQSDVINESNWKVLSLTSECSTELSKLIESSDRVLSPQVPTSGTRYGRAAIEARGDDAMRGGPTGEPGGILSRSASC